MSASPMHGGIPHVDHLVVGLQVVQKPLGRHRVRLQALGAPVHLVVDAVVEIENLQVLEMVGLKSLSTALECINRPPFSS